MTSMVAILYYLLKVSISLGVVFLFYQLVLRRLTFYNWNRWFLLGYSVLSFIIPFFNIAPVLEKNDWSGSQVINWVPVVHSGSVAGIGDNTNSLSATEIAGLLLLSGMILMLVRLLLQLLSFRKMVKKAACLSDQGMKLYEVSDPIIPFSFGNAIFINRKQHSPAELQEIIRHEFVHIRQRHSIDMLWTELLCLLNWFNPFAWLLKKAIRQNLEFIADQEVLQHGIPKKEYQYLLLKVTGNNQYSIATPFNFSSLKKRIAMMNKLQSARVHLVRFLFILPLLAVLLLAFRGQWNHEKTTTAQEQHLSQSDKQLSMDTIPAPAAQNDLNEKGYLISITDTKGNCTVLVKDRENKVVKKVLLTEWAKKESYYEGLYGALPPPPPPPPPGRAGVIEEHPLAPAAPGIPVMGVVLEERPLPPVPPAPAVPVKLPAHVKSISIQDDKAVVQLKDGNTETYLFSDPAQQKSFENKYGKMPEPPPPPPAKKVKGTGVYEERRLDAPVSEKRVEVMGVPLGNDKISDQVVYLIDGKKTSREEVNQLAPSAISRVNVIKDKQALQAYNAEDKNGVIEIVTRSAANSGTKALVEVKNQDLSRTDASLNGPGSGNGIMLKTVEAEPLIMYDGKEISKAGMNKIPANTIESVRVLKDKDATDSYGLKGKNGVIIIASKKK